MDIYKEAIMQNLKVQTSRGELTPQQLVTLSMDELDKLAVSLEEEHATSGKKSFLVKRSVKDKTAKLKFDLVLDIMLTKQAQEEQRAEALATKKHNERIMEVIAGKEDAELKGKSVKQLKAMLK